MTTLTLVDPQPMETHPDHLKWGGLFYRYDDDEGREVTAPCTISFYYSMLNVYTFHAWSRTATFGEVSL